MDAGEAVERLDALTRRLRAECPWDREQDERTIVPHTVEEAYELADAAHRGDDAKLLDELGDVLFQVHFLALLLEERGAGSLADVARHVHDKLVHRHPHVFSEVEVEGAAEVLANWDQIKKGEAGREPGIFGEVPENLPGPLYARKVQRRARSSGLELDPEPVVETAGRCRPRSPRIATRRSRRQATPSSRRSTRPGGCASTRSSPCGRRPVGSGDRVDAAERLGEESGSAWDALSPDRRRQFYAQARQA
jgi:XTP/dITP diphosphohydrolase/tetrapyrrole methylase family protein/MazG family protein/ATP diphosphatase